MSARTLSVKTRPRIEPRRVADATLDQTAEFLKTLAHPHRLRMVQMLLQGPYIVGELADACGIPSHMASEHLRLMQRSGLLTRRKEGRKAYYEIAQTRLASFVACIEACFR